MVPERLSALLAFLAGLASFLSPCVLPLIPSYLSYMTGLSVQELSGSGTQKASFQKVSMHALLFIVGFSSVFIVLGASASALGRVFAEHQRIFRQLGGVLVILLGAYLAGFLKIAFFSKERKFSLPGHPSGFLSSFLVGTVFAFGWTPCVGPILGSILILAGTSQDLKRGIFFLLLYSLGLAVPFFVSALAMNFFLSSFQKIKRYLRWIEVGSGLVLMGIGTLLVTNAIFGLTGFLNRALSPLTQLFNW